MDEIAEYEQALAALKRHYAQLLDGSKPVPLIELLNALELAIVTIEQQIEEQDDLR
jgi:hypothetical protein